MSANVIIAGGGFRGIVSAYLLRKRGHNVTLVERAPFLGAVLWPFEWEEHGLILDKGCHLFGSGDQVNDDIMLDILDGNFQSHDMRVASVYNGAKSVDSVVPDLMSLPKEEVATILSQIIGVAAHDPDVAGAQNLAETFKRRFGPAAAIHLNRMCEKIATSSPGNLSPAAISTTLGLRVKIVDDKSAALLKKLGPLDDRIAATNVSDPYKYLKTSNPKIPHRHFYPKTGGTGALPRAAKAYLENAGCNIYLGTMIDGFKADADGISLEISGKKQHFDYMIWALDTGLLSQIALGEDLASSKVHATPMGLYYFLTPRNEIGDLSFIQNYDPHYLTFRVSSAGAYSNQITADGNSYICSEITTKLGTDLWENPERYADKIWKEALELGMVQSKKPVDTLVKKTPISYKHEKVGFEGAFRTVEAELSKITDRIIITDPMVLGYVAIMEMLDQIDV